MIAKDKSSKQSACDHSIDDQFSIVANQKKENICNTNPQNQLKYPRLKMWQLVSRKHGYQ